MNKYLLALLLLISTSATADIFLCRYDRLATLEQSGYIAQQFLVGFAVEDNASLTGKALLDDTGAGVDVEYARLNGNHVFYSANYTLSDNGGALTASIATNGDSTWQVMWFEEEGLEARLYHGTCGSEE